MNFTDLTIRPFAPADQIPARRLIQEGLGEHFGVIDETCNPDIDDIAAYYIATGHVFLVAEDAAGIAATAALIFDGAGQGQLVRVSVALRCRRRGLGRALVMRLVAIGRARRLARLWMETNDDWDAAIGLYRSCGFEEFDRREGNVYMALNLSRNPAPVSA